jgi:hypothetical protein
VVGEVKGSFFAQCPVWLHLKQAPGGVRCCPAVEEVASGQPLRAGPFTGLKPHLSY